MPVRVAQSLLPGVRVQRINMYVNELCVGLLLSMCLNNRLHDVATGRPDVTIGITMSRNSSPEAGPGRSGNPCQGPGQNKESAFRFVRYGRDFKPFLISSHSVAIEDNFVFGFCMVTTECAAQRLPGLCNHLFWSSLNASSGTRRQTSYCLQCPACISTA
jgi:hypothetical protein